MLWYNGFHQLPCFNNNNFHIVYQVETHFSHLSKETSNFWLPTVVFSPVILFPVTKTVSSSALLCLLVSNNLQFLDHHLHLPKTCPTYQSYNDLTLFLDLWKPVNVFCVYCNTGWPKDKCGWTIFTETEQALVSHPQAYLFQDQTPFISWNSKGQLKTVNLFLKGFLIRYSYSQR